MAWVCDECGAIFLRRDERIDHVEQEHSGRWRCGICLEAYDNPHALAGHKKRHLYDGTMPDRAPQHVPKPKPPTSRSGIDEWWADFGRLMETAPKDVEVLIRRSERRT